MAMVNIPSTNDDPSYRYKMPRLVSKKEGRGNGSKTCIVNMPEVARALKRPAQYTTKWFGAELGAQSTYTDKEGEGVRAIINGHHDTPIFQTSLDKFIDKYVLCANCHLPEIDMFVKKGNIVGKCRACGWAGELDNNHKLATFIIKNPPSDDGGFSIVNLATEGGGADGKKSKDERRKERDEKRKGSKDKGEEGGEDGEEEEDEEAKEKRRAERRAKKESGEKKEKKERSGEKKSKKEKKEKTGEEGEDGEEVDDEEKEKRRQERKEKRAAKEKKEKSGEKKEKKDKSGEKKEKKERPSKKEEEPADSDDNSGDGDDKEDEAAEYDGEIAQAVIGIMKEFVQSKGGKAKPDDFFEELRMQQLAKLFDHKIRFFVALESLMPAGAMDAKAVAEHKPVLDKVLSAVKMPESDILWCFNAYLSQNEKSVKSFPMVLKIIYDEDWASEASILKYYVEEEGDGEPGFQAAKTSAAPFLKWLQTAEESDDDSEEDEDSD